jgi:hypothetical protein
MKFIEIKQSELKSITLFLIDKKIILHPKISPEGIPDFTGYEGKRFVLILDRNLLVRVLRLVNSGELKDRDSLKIISSLLLWSAFNNVTLNSGLALAEYSHFHKGNIESSAENNIFLKIFEQYTPQHWLDLATDKATTIPKISLKEEKYYSFFIEDDHFKMHYLEMLKLSQLYFNDIITIEIKFELFFQWIYSNILICEYTTFFAAILLGKKSKVFRNVETNFDSINKICKNVAWDLTYLSFWSTQYYYESTANDIYLFATMDKELTELFFITNRGSLDIYTKIFGKATAAKIISKLSEIYQPRNKPDIDQQNLDKMIIKEQENLREVIKLKYAI